MGKKLVIVIAALFLLSGCATLRGWVEQGSQEYVYNYETGVKVSQNILRAWPFYSALVKAYLGADYNKLPGEVLDAIKAIDDIVVDYNEDDPIVRDGYLGEMLGAWLRIQTEVTLSIIKKFAPDLLEIIPLDPMLWVTS